jgi:hypothetical protein
MKNLSDIKAQVNEAQTEYTLAETKRNAKLFAIYIDCQEIKDLMTALENVDETRSRYALDHDAELISYIDLSKDYVALPGIEEFLNDVYPWAHLNLKDKRIEQTHGDYIFVNWYPDRGCVFVGTTHGKTIIRNKEPYMDAAYVEAVIERHMVQNGYFPDVIKVTSDFEYDSHFNMREYKGLKTPDELTKIIDAMTPNEEE